MTWRIALLAAALGAVNAAPLLREMTWTAHSETLARDLTVAPRECLHQAAGADADAIELGRALFRSPTLLGGPAARVGLSCNSCHQNGRTNSRFLLPELTDIPGAADVTSEWSSAVRGDGVMNPRRIPDLAGAGARTSFGTQHEASLDVFVRGVIEEEFQGPPAPPAAFAAVLAYLRALDVCSADLAPLTLTDAAQDVRRARAAAQRSAEAGDDASAALALLAAQDGVGRIVERLPPRRFAAARRELANLSRDLTQTRRAPNFAAALAAPGWRVRFDAAIQKLARREAQTYFNERTLAAALRAR